ncbi:MAG: hypothetical protein IAG10_32895 [Planctomycetaceae bacterium]|nr:hypothetical protein [Planctomycetaceae bacterium]
MIAPKPGTFSSEVDLQMIVGNQTLSVSKIGPERLTLEQPTFLPPCEAEVVLTVDGQTSRWTVRLPDGASAESRQVKTEQVAFYG